MSDALPLGAMVVVGFEPAPLPEQLDRLEPTRIRHLELYPNWAESPPPEPTRATCAEFGMAIHSVHAAWGTESFSGERIDLASTDETVRHRSVEQVGRSVDYAGGVEASCLVVHPGIHSQPSENARRTDRLRASVDELLPAAREASVRLCLENLPGKAFPGRDMRELTAFVAEYDDPLVGICLDTGHSHIANSVAADIRIAGSLLATTHFHDNDGITDLHVGPTFGTIPWEQAAEAFAEVGYAGPLMLECVGWSREQADRLGTDYLSRLYRICERSAGNSRG